MSAETSKELEDALAGDRTATRAILAGFARGEFGPDAQGWLQAIAARLLIADDEADPKRRPDRIIEAIGLRGRADADAELLAVVRALDAFGKDTGAVLQHLRQVGLIAPAVDDGDARRKIERLRAGIRGSSGEVRT